MSGLELHQSSGVVYEFYFAQGTTLKLSGLRDSYGNYQLITRDLYRGQVETITHSDGHTLGFFRHHPEDTDQVPTHRAGNNELDRPLGNEQIDVRYTQGVAFRTETLLTYTLNPQGYLVDVNGSADRDYAYSYDRAGRLLTRTAHDGVNWGRYEYDSQGRVVSTSNAEGYFSGQFDYPEPGLTVYHNPLGGVTRYHYDHQQRITKVEHCNEGVSHYHWQGDLLLKAEDALGRVIEESLNGEAITSHYQADGLRSNISGQDYQEQRHYQQLNQLTELSLGEHDALNFSYTPRGQEQRRYSNNGFQHQQDYTARGFLKQQRTDRHYPEIPETAVGGQTQRPLNAFDDQQHTQRYQWNKAGQLSAWQHSNGTTALHYDKAGQITQVSHTVLAT